MTLARRHGRGVCRRAPPARRRSPSSTTRQLGIYRAEVIPAPAPSGSPGATPTPSPTPDRQSASPAPASAGTQDEPLLFAVDLFTQRRVEHPPGRRRALVGAGRGRARPSARDAAPRATSSGRCSRRWRCSSWSSSGSSMSATARGACSTGMRGLNPLAGRRRCAPGERRMSLPFTVSRPELLLAGLAAVRDHSGLSHRRAPPPGARAGAARLC